MVWVQPRTGRLCTTPIIPGAHQHISDISEVRCLDRTQRMVSTAAPSDHREASFLRLTQHSIIKKEILCVSYMDYNLHLMYKPVENDN